MSLPKQVQDRLDEAERIQAQLAPAPDTPTDPPAPPSEPIPEPPIAPAPAPVADEETFQRRFLTLQGKYNAELPRAQNRIRELEASIQTLEHRINAMALAQSQAPAAPGTDKDVEAFGSDLVDLVRRQATEVARREAEARLSAATQQTAQLDERVKSVSQAQAQAAHERYTNDVKTLVPDFDAMNVDPGFIGWLADVDQFSGQTRQDMLLAAFNARDAHRTATFFNTYKALTAPVEVAPAPAVDNRQRLERQVAPGSSKSSAPNSPAAAEPKWFSQAEIQAFYKGVATGEYRGKDAELARAEAEIDAAVAAGRVR